LALDISNDHKYLDLKWQVWRGMDSKTDDLAEVDLVLLTLTDVGTTRKCTCLLLGRPEPDSQIYQRIGLAELLVWEKGANTGCPKPDPRDLEPFMKEITIR